MVAVDALVSGWSVPGRADRKERCVNWAPDRRETDRNGRRPGVTVGLIEMEGSGRVVSAKVRHQTRAREEIRDEGSYVHTGPPSNSIRASQSSMDCSTPHVSHAHSLSREGDEWGNDIVRSDASEIGFIGGKRREEVAIMIEDSVQRMSNIRAK